MQHLADDSFVAVKSPPDVLWILNDQKSDIQELFQRPSFTYNDFVAFLEHRGWAADRKDGFKLKWDVSAGAKWEKKKGERRDGESTARGALGAYSNAKDVKKDATAPDLTYNRHEIWQAWLFFALIACVVRKRRNPKQHSGGQERQGDHSHDTIPILTFEDLVTPGGELLTTEKLPAALQQWHDCIKATTPKAKLRSRLIEADRALELAHRVIRANLVPSASRPQERAALAVSSLRKRHMNGRAYGQGFASQLNGGVLAVNPLDLTSEVAPQAGPPDDDEPYDEQFSEMALCLMVLGETLSAAKKQVMNDLGLRINGWLVEDDEGWGPPSYVLSKMETMGWCPRARAVLQGQLGSSAILLYTAFEVHQKKPIDRTDHQHCNAMVCYHVPGVDDPVSGKKIFYEPQHHSDQLRCASGNARVECRLRGPRMPVLYKILNDTILATEGSDFPILRIVTFKDPKGRQRVVGVSVERWSIEDQRGLRKPNFTAISHVWSQGMGNEGSNRLQECQLEVIYRALAAVEDDKNYLTEYDNTFKTKLLKQALDDEFTGEPDSYALSSPFWMDTLTIPVKQHDSPKNFKELKMRSIRQIYHVFSMAARVVVIDKELCDEIQRKPFTIIISLLTSAWMQRLWTLQEAFLSRSLLVAFKGQGVKSSVELTHTHGTFLKLQDIDSRIRELDRLQKDAHTTAMAELVKRKFFHNLMGEDREIRNRNDHPIQTRGSMVIASAWRSSRWRVSTTALSKEYDGSSHGLLMTQNTSRLEDETLALSTLLNLDYRTTAIEEATVAEPISSVQQPTLGADESLGRNQGDEEERKSKRERMMCDFWTLIHRNYEGSIPAGLIFLPGDKLPLQGFGWAPTSWMSAKDEYYPYPLSIMSKATELHEEGLLVQYPGFLLQCGHPNAVLGSNLGKSGLKFPIDQYISEWYQIKAIGGASRAEYGAAQKILPRTFAHAPPEFGVILCRPKPREWPEEIGVLVEIYREAWKRKEPERVSRKYYYCQIVRRVWVSRYVPTPEELRNYRLPAGRTGDPPIGELVPEDTFWYVDGYQANRDDPSLASDTHASQQPPAVIKMPEHGGTGGNNRANGNPERAFALMRRFTGTQQPVSARAVETSGSGTGKHGRHMDVAGEDVQNGQPPSPNDSPHHSTSAFSWMRGVFGRSSGP